MRRCCPSRKRERQRYRSHPMTASPQRILIGLYGAGGFGREVMPFAPEAAQYLLQAHPGAQLDICFIETDPRQSQANGHLIYTEDHFLGQPHTQKYFNITIGDARARHTLAQRLTAAGARPASLRAPQAIIYSGNIIGEGAILCAHTTITSNTRIGCYFHLNLNSYVAHDCVIGDYVTFAPGVHCNGNVHIGHHAYIGAGAVIKQGSAQRPLLIGEGATIGMGAVVTKDVPPHTTVIGNPARPL